MVINDDSIPIRARLNGFQNDEIYNINGNLRSAEKRGFSVDEAFRVCCSLHDALDGVTQFWDQNVYDYPNELHYFSRHAYQAFNIKPNPREQMTIKEKEGQERNEAFRKVNYQHLIESHKLENGLPDDRTPMEKDLAAVQALKLPDEDDDSDWEDDEFLSC